MLPKSANPTKPNTYEIFVDFTEDDQIVPRKIAYFEESEAELAEQTLKTLKAKSYYNVRLVVKGI